MDYMMTSGLDALMMTKFHMTLSKILFSCMIYGVFVLCPVHNQGTDLETSTDENYECKIIDANKDMNITAPFTSGVCCPDNDGSPGICTCSQLYANFSASPDALPWNGYPPKCTVPSIYTKLTMANIDKNSGGQNPLVWYDVFGAYLFLGVAMYFFTRTWEEYVKYRHFWLSKVRMKRQKLLPHHHPISNNTTPTPSHALKIRPSWSTTYPCTCVQTTRCTLFFPLCFRIKSPRAV